MNVCITYTINIQLKSNTQHRCVPSDIIQGAGPRNVVHSGGQRLVTSIIEHCFVSWQTFLSSHSRLVLCRLVPRAQFQVEVCCVPVV